MNPDALVYLIPLGGMAVGSLFMVGVYKIVTRWMDTRHPRVEGADPVELDQMRADIAGVVGLRERVTELEERVDFTERLLAQRADRDRLEPGA